MLRIRSLLPFAIALKFSAEPATAQCAVVPDGLDGGPCCTTVVPTLPQFPVVLTDAFNICWRDCDVENLASCNMRLGRLRPLVGQPTSCGAFRSKIRFNDPTTGDKKWSGKVVLTYSRTWHEVDPSGGEYQVWRFILHTKLKPTADAGLTPCPVPPCATTFGNVRFTGYIDYARDCSTNQFSFAWMLNHSCDVIDHQPGFPRSGFFHPNRAYTFVGPATGFAVGPIQPIASGGSADEAVRRLRLPLAVPDTLCEYEELVDAGLEVLQELCLCGFPTAPLQYAISDLGLGGSCGTSIFTPGGPYLPGYVSMGIGSWTAPGTYPGLEVLRWTTGGYDYFDPCTGNTREEVFFGVTTLGGWSTARIVGTGTLFPISQTFVDQVNSLKKSDGTSTTMNKGYLSDHVLNLNF